MHVDIETIMDSMLCTERDHYQPINQKYLYYNSKTQLKDK